MGSQTKYTNLYRHSHFWEILYAQVGNMISCCVAVRFSSDHQCDSDSPNQSRSTTVGLNPDVVRLHKQAASHRGITGKKQTASQAERG